MATTKSMKALCHLVCQASSQISEEVLHQELERNVEILQNGILSYPKLKSENSCTKKSGKLSTFIFELSKFIGVEESNTKGILQTYLSGNPLFFFLKIQKLYFLLLFRRLSWDQRIFEKTN